MLPIKRITVSDCIIRCGILSDYTIVPENAYFSNHTTVHETAYFSKSLFKTVATQYRKTRNKPNVRSTSYSAGLFGRVQSSNSIIRQGGVCNFLVNFDGVSTIVFHFNAGTL